MKKTVTVADTEEALGVLEIALTLDEAITVALTLLSERHGKAAQLAGLSLALRILQNERFPELLPVMKAVPKTLLKEFNTTKDMLNKARSLAYAPTKGTLQ